MAASLAPSRDPAAIGAHLPSLSPGDTDRLNQLWSMPDSDKAPLVLRPSSRCPHRGWLALDFGAATLNALFLDQRDTEHWDRFQSGLAEEFWLDSRLAQHAQAIEQLEIALAQRADAIRLAAPPAAVSLPLFEIYLKAQREPLALIQFDADMLSDLVARGRVRIPCHRLDRKHLLGLQCPCIVSLLGRPTGSGRLRDVAPGDVFVIGWRHALDRSLRLQSPVGRWRLHARPDGSARIEVRENFRSTQEGHMNTDSKDDASKESGPDSSRDAPDTSDTVVQDQAAHDERLDDLPLEVAFELGQMKLSIAELERLKPGYVFSLPVPVEGTNVTIRVQGRALGRGQIVAIGEYLGVRVQRWSGDGSGDD